MTGNNEQLVSCDCGAEPDENGVRRHALWCKLFTEAYERDHTAGPCEKCSESDERVLEFHHVDRNEKSFQITHQTWFSKPLRLLIEELAKCKVLCANCHRREEYDDSGKWAGRKLQNW